MKTVVGLGEALWDVYPDARYPGGAPANVALHAGQMGAKGVVASSVGVDESGDALIQKIHDLGAVTRFIQKNFIYETGKVKITLDASGVPHFICSQDVAFDHLVWSEDMEDLSRTCDAVIVGTLAQRNRDSRAVIQRFLESAKQAIKVFDVNFRSWSQEVELVVRDTLPQVDILKMNEAELDQLRKSFQQCKLSDQAFLTWIIRKYHLKIAALTLGAQGCVLSDGNAFVRISGESVEVIDTTGCGDAFVAGMIVKQLAGASLEETARFANHVGAMVATKKGAVPRL